MYCLICLNKTKGSFAFSLFWYAVDTSSKKNDSFVFDVCCAENVLMKEVLEELRLLCLCVGGVGDQVLAVCPK